MGLIYIKAINHNIDGNASHSTAHINDTSNKRINSYDLENLKCASPNVCGLKQRLNGPDFCDLVHEYNFFCVSETKIAVTGSISVQDYRGFF